MAEFAQAASPASQPVSFPDTPAHRWLTDLLGDHKYAYIVAPMVRPTHLFVLYHFEYHFDNSLFT